MKASTYFHISCNLQFQIGRLCMYVYDANSWLSVLFKFQYPCHFRHIDKPVYIVFSSQTEDWRDHFHTILFVGLWTSVYQHQVQQNQSKNSFHRYHRYPRHGISDTCARNLFIPCSTYLPSNLLYLPPD